MGERRDAYVEKLKVKLDEWNAEIDRLQAKADQIRTGSRTEYQNRVENLRTKRAEIEQKITGLREASEGAWKDLKSGTDRARKAMDKAVHAAVAHFK